MAKKNHTLLAMLAGAALAGGFLYAKKLNEEKAAPAPEGEGAAPDGENPENEYGWKATFTDESGETVSSEEAVAEFKEEAAKALNEFKETAKAASAGIVTGFKKAFEEMKAAVADAEQAAEERRAEAAEEAEGEPCCEVKEGCCEAAEEAATEAKEAAEDACEAVEEKAEDIQEAAEELKEAAEDKIEEIKDAFEDVKEAVEGAVEEIRE